MELYTFNSLAERSIRDLSGGDIPADSPYSMAFARQHVRDGLQSHLKLDILRRRAGDEDDKTAVQPFIATYQDIPVILDRATARVYAELPGYFISLKHNKGIHSVSQMTKSHKPMIRTATPTISARVPAGDLEKQNYLYYIEGMRIYWLRDIKKENIHKVLIKLITAAPSAFGDDDPLPIIPEMVGELMMYVKNQMQNKFPQDRLNDGNPNIRQLNEQQK